MIAGSATLTQAPRGIGYADFTAPGVPRSGTPNGIGYADFTAPGVPRSGTPNGIGFADSTHTGTTPERLYGRSIFLPAAISSARQIVLRVSRGLITSSIMSLPGAKES